LSPEYQRWRFNIFVDEKEELLQKIFANGLFASSHYASLAGIMDNGMAPNAEILYKRVINLFNDLRVGVEQAEKLVEIISRHC
jgi:dTDP-4-dehydrorhamnose 3,5-epimerase-like enzyme